MSGRSLSRIRRVELGDLVLIPRMLVWTLLIPVLKRLVPLPKLARLMWVNHRTDGPRRDRQRRIVRAARLLLRARPLGRDENCLDRSLVLYRFLSMERLDPCLVLGVRRENQAVKGHAWVTVDGRPVVEDSVADFAPIAIIGPAGAVETVAGERPENALAPFDLRR